MAVSISVSSESKIRPYRPLGRIVHFDVQDGVSIERGDIVVESSDTDSPGGIVEASADPTAIVGVAAEDNGTSVAGNLAKIAVYVADAESEFVAHVQDTGVPTKADVGLSCGLVKDTTNDIWRVDLSDTTNVSVKIVQVLNPLDTNGRVVFRFLNAAAAIYGV